MQPGGHRFDSVRLHQLEALERNHEFADEALPRRHAADLQGRGLFDIVKGGVVLCTTVETALGAASSRLRS